MTDDLNGAEQTGAEQNDDIAVNGGIVSEDEDFDLYTVTLENNKKSVFIGTSSVIGKRENQQDAIRADTDYTFAGSGKAIAVLCDGMGGFANGEKASNLCASIFFEAFHSFDELPSVPDFYRSAISLADKEVAEIGTDKGAAPSKSGTTLASVIIQGDLLYWASVGDSRIYMVRDGEILCITQDHNYLMLLNERVKAGTITQEEADNDTKKEMLVSYIGMEGVRYVDMNIKPFRLADGDRIILCSDGVYRGLSDDEIRDAVSVDGAEAQSAADALTDLVLSKNYKHQDNASAIVIAYQDSEEATTFDDPIQKNTKGEN